MPEEKYKIGQRVRLIPSQGVYQKPLNGTIISLTRTQTTFIYSKTCKQED